MFRGYRHTVIALGLIALLCVPALGQEGQPQGIGEDEEAGEQAQEDRPGDTAVEDQIVSPVETPQAEISASDAEGDDQATEHQQTQQPIFDWRSFVSAEDTLAQWIMAAFGIVATGVSIWAIMLLRRTLRESRRATEAALRAAEAADATVDVTRDIGQRQIRAYMVADADIRWVIDTINANIYGVHVQWKNSGDTPARRCHGRASAKVFDDVMPVDFDYPDLLIPSVTETNHVGPGQSLWFGVGGIDGRDVIAAERGEKHIYVWSWIEYDDIFGCPRRRTELCFKLHISESGATCFASISGPFNGADEDCHHQTKT